MCGASLALAAVLLVLGFCLRSWGSAIPRLPWTEVMGDSKEAGAEAPPAGATARGGLSLLSQGESEEPSAQVSPPCGGTCRVPELRARSAGVEFHGSRRRLLAPSPRLSGTRPNTVEAYVTVVKYSGVYLQVVRIKSSPGFPLDGSGQVS